jgi:hypothetical protein
MTSSALPQSTIYKPMITPIAPIKLTQMRQNNHLVRIIILVEIAINSNFGKNRH